MNENEVLTFTIKQLRDILINAYYTPPPENLERTKTQVDLCLQEEWHKQQQAESYRISETNAAAEKDTQS